ncbi:MAG: metallophosphoesterase, partial [Hafnia sp.]
MSKLLKLTRNTKGIDLFVGDIHGCFTLLEKALEEAGFNKKTDRLICLGDLTDRGPESHRATDFLEESWFISLQGNHDAFVCKTAELMLADDKQMNTSTDVRTCISNGGRWVAMQSDHELKRIVQTFSQLPLAIEYMDEAGNVLAGMVHGEVDYDHTWEEFKAELEKLPHDYVYSLDDDSERAINVAVWG